jgi:hypothetical protein
MSQTIEGRLKAVARRLGVSVDEYRTQVASGNKWCVGCKAWHAVSAFGADRSRADGLNTVCRDRKSAAAKEKYQPRPRSPRGFLKPTRDGDKAQARRRINYLVEQRKIPAPGSLPCVDCGHLGKDRRHEYDHARGYDGPNQLYVEAVCAPCHHRREAEREA